jgi:predicted TIM-barrel fold metal-dependent hydrolase
MLDNIMTMADLTLTGVLDRFPKLNVYFIEAGHSWVPEVLYRLDKTFYLYKGWFPEAKSLPSEVFKRQMYVPFEGGGQQLLAAEGFVKLADNLFWASDIPHHDSDPPEEAVQAFKRLGVPEDVQAKIMGENASKFTGISLNDA